MLAKSLKILLKEFIFSNVAGLKPVILLKRPRLQALLKDFFYYLETPFSRETVLASVIAYLINFILQTPSNGCL